MGCSTKTTCPYCGVGCGVVATPMPNGRVDIKGDEDHPSNFGKLCSKGAALGETLDLEGRLLSPEINGKAASWDDALDLVAQKFKQTIADYGPDSVAFYVSGQMLTEDYYVANKLMKGFFGSANIDTNSRLCMASSVAGHRRAFGSDTVPGIYEDLELADVIVLVGSNLAWCHPVIYQRIVAAKAIRPNMKVVLVDPRRTMTADIADIHLAVAPDSDVALFNGLLSYISQQGAIDADYVARHTNGLPEALEAAQSLSFEKLVERTGLPAAELSAFYALWTGNEKVVTVYSQGVNQSLSGTDKVNAIINCHLATGRIGRPGMGPFSITGQPNAMGGREVGGLANMLASHMALEEPAHRELVQRFWNAPVIADKPGLKAVEMFDAVADGRIKAIWIMATNPVVSMPDAGAIENALKACPFVVVSDIMGKTDTVRHAHVKLPSLGWGEKDGTVTNSERRISHQKKFLPSPGNAKADWWQMAEVAKRMGFGKAFDYDSTAAIFREYTALTAFENNGKRDLDIGAYAEISDQDYSALKPFQWPAPMRKMQTTQDQRFFANGGFFTVDGKANFVAASEPSESAVKAHYPFTLNTGRIRDHWHTMTRTAKSPRLSAHIAEPFVEIHPSDALKKNIRDADLVCIKNGRSEIIVRALITDRVKQGHIFVPMHFTDQIAANARVDKLVAPATDPISGQPALKNTHVDIAKYPAKQFGFVVSAAKPKLSELSYWALAKAENGWCAEFASTDPIVDMAQLAYKMLQLPQQVQTLSYTDNALGLTRIAAFNKAALLGVVYLSRSPVAVSRNWASSQLGDDFSDLVSRWRVVAGRPASGVPDKGTIICSCMGVGINQIRDAVSAGCHTVNAVGNATCAGTNCGSCKAELKVIIDEYQIVAAE
ncbi:nitrate reductase [Ahrensia marina]|uniref:Nitrate reductase n=1 Tax=Ahrensia marina TaxID=1514904 RepID=A0A0M9GP06_9HYPH|nr:nitrate reductase [Ahrensia marina]KPB02006.1 nitrate reductase [Ahrensia marina]